MLEDNGKQKAFEVIKSIDNNMMNMKDAEILYELCKKYVPINGVVVEIGTCAGNSTIALAQAVKEKDLYGTITSIDINKNPYIDKNLKKANVFLNVSQIVDKSSLVAKWFDSPIDMLWIDGDHRSKGVEADIINWAGKVKVGGIIAFHDYPDVDEVCLEVHRAVYKHLFSKPHKWRVIIDREGKSVLAFERIDRKFIHTKKWHSEKKQYWFKANIKWYFENIFQRIL